MQRQPEQTGLAYFQEKFLELLWNETDPEEIRCALLSDPKLMEFQAYIEAMDAHMIEIAHELVHKWGVGGEVG